MYKKNIFILLLILFAIELFSSPDVFNSYFINAAKSVKPSVVNIIIYKTKPKGKKSFQKVSEGSGTIISSEGYIITNYHLVVKGDFYQIIFSDGSKFDAKKFSNGEYYIADLKTDIAVIKIDNPDRIKFKPIRFADSNILQDGEWVIAIGSPYGLKHSITSGIVSSKGRDNIGFADIEDFIQSDVSLNPGNSGGPLINLRGSMVGINTAIRTVSGGYQGISFAIPSNIVKQVYRELRIHGRVRRGWLGFIAKEKKVYRKVEGLIVEIISVIRRSPADKAGLQKGDIIRKIDGKKIESLGRLIKTVGNKSIGTKLYITVSRDGHLYDFSIILREKHIYRKIQKGLKKLFSLYGIEIDENADSEEIVISYLSPGSLVYGLEKGDIIISMNGFKITNLEDFIKRFYRSDSRIQRMKIYRDSGYFEIDFDRIQDY